ncbi:TPA: phage scaffolding protein [Clostridium sporogenes]
MPKLNEILGESYSQIPEDIKTKYKDIDLVDSSSCVTKEKYNSLETTKNDIEGQLKTANTTIKDLKKNNEGNEELQNKIEQYEKDYKKLKEDSDKKIADMQFNYAIEKALGKAGAKNSKAVEALLDREKIKLDGETLIGLDEQLTGLKTSDPYLFGEDKISSPKPGDGKSDPGDSDLATKIAEERNKQIQNPYEKLWS